MEKIEPGVHECYVCKRILFPPEKISHKENLDGKITFRHLWHGETSLLTETDITSYATSPKVARQRAEAHLKDSSLSAQLHTEAKAILEDLERMGE